MNYLEAAKQALKTKDYEALKVAIAAEIYVQAVLIAGIKKPNRTAFAADAIAAAQTFIETLNHQ